MGTTQAVGQPSGQNVNTFLLLSLITNQGQISSSILLSQKWGFFQTKGHSDVACSVSLGLTPAASIASTQRNRRGTGVGNGTQYSSLISFQSLCLIDEDTSHMCLIKLSFSEVPKYRLCCLSKEQFPLSGCERDLDGRPLQSHSHLTNSDLRTLFSFSLVSFWMKILS